MVVTLSSTADFIGKTNSQAIYATASLDEPDHTAGSLASSMRTMLRPTTVSNVRMVAVAWVAVAWAVVAWAVVAWAVVAWAVVAWAVAAWAVAAA